MTLRIKHTIAHILSLFLIKKRWRRNTQRFIEEMNISTPISLISFLGHSIKDKTVLLVEPNDFHAQCLPGYTKYLLDLGYRVDVLMTKKNFKDNPFVRFEDPQIKLFQYSRRWLRFILKLKKINQYEFVVITTSRYFSDEPEKQGRSYSIQEELGFVPTGKRKTLFINHDTTEIDLFNFQKFEKNNQIITLGNFNRGTMVHPFYIGPTISKPLNQKRRFICVGGLYAVCKNHGLLIDALQILHKKNIDCEVVIVGSGSLDKIPAHLRHYIKLTGYLKFPTMYNEMEKSDFFLPLLDPLTSEHERYITTGITGSYALILGFNKPCLIAKHFASFYGFNQTNSFVYSHDLADAMIEAIRLTQSEYNNKCNALKELAQKNYSESLQNLKEMIS